MCFLQGCADRQGQKQGMSTRMANVNGQRGTQYEYSIMSALLHTNSWKKWERAGSWRKCLSWFVTHCCRRMNIDPNWTKMIYLFSIPGLIRFIEYLVFVLISETVISPYPGFEKRSYATWRTLKEAGFWLLLKTWSCSVSVFTCTWVSRLWASFNDNIWDDIYIYSVKPGYSNYGKL